jgi:hypothetical protein
LLFVASIWLALVGFALMLASGLVVYHHLRRMGKDQLRSGPSGRTPSPPSRLRLAPSSQPVRYSSSP